MTLYIHRPYTYIGSKYNIYLYELCKQEEKRVFGKLFEAVSWRVQVNLIFFNNVRIFS
jgi:hypothetical protein